MKSLYSIILAAGCLLSSGAYGMEVEELDGRIEKLAQRITDFKQELNRLQYPKEKFDTISYLSQKRQRLNEELQKLKKQSQRILSQENKIVSEIDENIKDSLDPLDSSLRLHPEIATEYNLKVWLAMAEGVERSRSKKSEKSKLRSQSPFWGSFFSEAIGLLGTCFIRRDAKRAAIQIPILLHMISKIGSDLPLSQFQVYWDEKEAQNAKNVLDYLKKNQSSSNMWFDEKNEHVQQVKLLINNFQPIELNAYLEKHGDESTIKANIENLQLLAITNTTEHDTSAPSEISEPFDFSNDLNYLSWIVKKYVLDNNSLIKRNWYEDEDNKEHVHAILTTFRDTVSEDTITEQQEKILLALRKQEKEEKEELERQDKEDGAAVLEPHLAPLQESIHKLEDRVDKQDEVIAAQGRIMKRNGIQRRNSF